MQKDFSVVIPVMNEEDSLRELVKNIKEAFSDLKKSYEIVFVDDGSTDSSLQILKGFAKDDKNIKIYSFRRNLGKSPALMQGFKAAEGKYILTLDADLQDDPANVRSMLDKMEKGHFDLVTGWRKNRKDSPFKIISSRLFNRVAVPFLFGVNLHDLNSGLKLYRRDLAKEISLYGGMHRFVPIIAAEMGYSVTEKETTHHERKYGVSKYKFTKMFTDIPDLITIYFLTKYNRRPLHFFGKIGSIVFGLGAVILIYLAYLRFLGQTIGDRPLLLFGILFVIAGLQIVLTGLIADLVVNFHSKDDDFPLKYASSR